MRAVASAGSTRLAPGLLGVALVGVVLVGGCTSLLGVDGEYGVDDGGGAGNGGGPSVTSSAAEATSSTGGGAPPATSTTSSSSSASSGDGGAGGAGSGSSGGGMGGAPPCDGVVVACVDEVLLDQVEDGALRPRLVGLDGGDAVLTYLTGPEGSVWRGVTDGAVLEGGHVPGLTADDVAALDALDLLVLRDGLVEVPAAADAGGRPRGGAPLGGGLYGAPLFAARPPDDGTIRYVVAEGDRSVSFTCPAGVACAESATGCELVEGPLAHTLDRRGTHVVVARACGGARQLRIDRENDAVVLADGVVNVLEVAVGQTELESTAFALTLGDEGPDRRVTMTRFEGAQAQSYELPGPYRPARSPVIEASLEGVFAVWVEVAAGGPVFRIMRCSAGSEFSCNDGWLHVLGPPLAEPRNLTMTDVQGGLLLAWEDGVGADATVRFAMLP